MSSLLEIETREIVDDRLRRARVARPAYGVRLRRRRLSLRPRVTGPLA